MSDLRPLYNHLGPFLMVLFRLSGLFMFAPLLSSSLLPGRLRLLFSLIFAIAIYPTIPAAQQAPIEMNLFTLAPAIAGEVLIGVVIGLLASLPMYAAQLGGLIIGHQAGLTLGQVYNPALDIESDAIGQLLQFVAIFAFVAIGGLELLFLSIASTFARLPVGSAGLTIAPLDLIVGLAGSGFDVALRVSAPVMCIILIETIGSSVLMKTIPQINIQSLGFATKIIAAFIALIAGIVAIESAVSEDTGRTLAAIVQWSRTIADDRNPSFAPHPVAASEGGR